MMKPIEQQPSQRIAEDNAAIRKLLADFLNIWPYVLLFILVNLILAYFISGSVNPVYQVQATMVIKQDRSPVSQELFESIGIKPSNNIENEIAILNSFNLAYNTVKALDFNVEYYQDKLWKNKEMYHTLPYQVEVDWKHKQLLEGVFEVKLLKNGVFNLTVKESKFKEYRPEEPDQWFSIDKEIILDGNYSLNKWITGPNFRFRLIRCAGSAVAINDFTFKLRSNYMLAEQYSKILQVEIQKKESTILNLIVETPMVEKGKKYLEKIIEGYQDRELRNKNLTATNTATFINQQLKSIKDSLVFFEDKLEQYRSNNQTFNLDQQSNLVLTRISELQTEQANSALKDRYYQNVLDYLNKEEINRLVVPSAVGIPDPLIDQLIAELITLQTDRLRLNQVLSDDNKTLKELNFRYRNVLNTLKESLKRSQQTVKLLLSDLQNRIDLMKSELSNMPQVERDLLSIKRQFSISENIYTYLLQKRDEAEISRASNIPASEILDSPRRNGGMISPKPVRNYLLGFSLGIIIPLLFLFFRNMFNRNIHDIAQFERMLSVPLIGSIGKGPKGPNKNIVANSPRSYVAENFRNIRANIRFLFQSNKPMVLAFTSSISGEGKTFCSINTASVYAVWGKKTILVGLDLRKPKIAEDFNLTNEIGLSNYLCHEKDLSKLIKASGQPNLDILLSGPIPPNPAELIATDRFIQLINELKEQYEVIILDCPPIGLVSETLDICRQTDLCFYVFRHQFSDWNTVQNLNDLVHKGLIKKCYAIYNDCSNMTGYNYGYGSAYYLEEEKPSLWKRILHYLKD